MPHVLVHRGTSFYREYSFSVDVPLIVIGRARANDIYLPDSSRRVSRYHATIVKMTTGSGYFVRDLGSLRSTRVDGRPVYQHLLRDGDVIEVGDYELVYSGQPRPRDEPSPLRVVHQKTNHDLTEKSTVLFTHREMLKEVRFSGIEREVVESLLQEVRRTASLDEVLTRIMPAVVRATHSVRGFAGVFDHKNPTSFRVVGRTALGTGDQIEITSADFLDRLTRMTPVSENHTLLVPLISRDVAIGFFCVDRDPAAERFSMRTAEFLLALGNLAGARLPGRRESVKGGQGDRPYEWGAQIVGRSRKMEQLLEEIHEAAVGDGNVLVTGESGTGKELVAKAIHAASLRRTGSFVAKNCAALTESLAEAELFGHAPKAGIAGADPEGAPGWFEMASGGTLFLDEIQGLSVALQDKFLRVLQEKEVWRLRGRKAIPVNVKVIAATDSDPEAAVESGRLRGPLYYRFATRIHVSPLMERQEDIPLLAHCFLDRQALGSSSPARAISHRALQALLDYAWPGNVRELENAVKTAVTRAAGREVLFSWDFPVPASARPLNTDEVEPTRLTPPAAPRAMAVVEKEKIMEALEYCRGNLSQACRLLGYKSRQTMLNKMDGYGIDRNHGDLEH